MSLRRSSGAKCLHRPRARALGYQGKHRIRGVDAEDNGRTTPRCLNGLHFFLAASSHLEWRICMRSFRMENLPPVTPKRVRFG